VQWPHWGRWRRGGRDSDVCVIVLTSLGDLGGALERVHDGVTGCDAECDAGLATSFADEPRLGE
jgi:hypothetical protein